MRQALVQRGTMNWVRWIYFGLALFFAAASLLIAFLAAPEERWILLKPCITAAVVNAVIFGLMEGFSRERRGSERKSKRKADK